VVNWASQTPLGGLGNQLANQLVQTQLLSGFTVVRTESGDAFQLGILQPPTRPKAPFEVTGEERLVYYNETTEVQAGQVDFIGPLAVPRSGQSLYFRIRASGPQAEAFVFQRQSAEQWVGALEASNTAPPPMTPVTSFPIQPGGDYWQEVHVPPGEYYLVVDHSAIAGTVNPPWAPLGVGVPPLVLSYTAELREK
jgi:hypothetical protein